jgi:hypothetical protein
MNATNYPVPRIHRTRTKYHCASRPLVLSSRLLGVQLRNGTRQCSAHPASCRINQIHRFWITGYLLLPHPSTFVVPWRVLKASRDWFALCNSSLSTHGTRSRISFEYLSSGSQKQVAGYSFHPSLPPLTHHEDRCGWIRLYWPWRDVGTCRGALLNCVDGRDCYFQLLNEHSKHEVHLYESDHRPGGHANTFTFSAPGKEPVDVDGSVGSALFCLSPLADDHQLP